MSVQGFIAKSTEQLGKGGAINDSMTQGKQHCSFIIDEVVLPSMKTFAMEKSKNRICQNRYQGEKELSDNLLSD